MSELLQRANAMRTKDPSDTKRRSNRRSSTPEKSRVDAIKASVDSHRRLSLDSSVEDRHLEHQEQWTEAVEHLHHGTRYSKANKPVADTIKIGDRVVVHGIHSGWLRYLGTVQFSGGVWAGELAIMAETYCI
jgi:hypothetical protein